MRISDWSSDVCSSDLDEAFADFGRGWEFGEAGVEMLAPRQLPLYALPKAWTPGTNGPVEGEAIAVKIDKLADLDKHKGQLRGKVVFLDELREYKPGDEDDFERHHGTTMEDLQAFTVPKDRRSEPANQDQESPHSTERP